MHKARIIIEAIALFHVLMFAALWLWSPVLAFWTAVAPHPDAAGFAAALTTVVCVTAGLIGIGARALGQLDP